MQRGIFGFPIDRRRDSSLYPYQRGVFHVKREVPGTYEFIVPDGFDYAVIDLSGAGGGGGTSPNVAGAEGGGGGAGAGLCKKIRVRQGFRLVMTVPAGGAGAIFNGTVSPVPSAAGGTTTCAVYNEYGELVTTLTATGGQGGASEASASPGGAGGTPSETVSLIVDNVTLFSQSGNTGDAGKTFGDDVGGYGADTHLKKFDPRESRSRGIGGPSNNMPGQAGVAPGSGGGGGVGSGNGGAGAPGIAWAVFIPSEAA